MKYEIHIKDFMKLDKQDSVKVSGRIRPAVDCSFKLGHCEQKIQFSILFQARSKQVFVVIQTNDRNVCWSINMYHHYT